MNDELKRWRELADMRMNNDLLARMRADLNSPAVDLATQLRKQVEQFRPPNLLAQVSAAFAGTSRSFHDEIMRRTSVEASNLLRATLHSLSDRWKLPRISDELAKLVPASGMSVADALKHLPRTSIGDLAADLRAFAESSRAATAPTMNELLGISLAAYTSLYGPFTPFAPGGGADEDADEVANFDSEEQAAQIETAAESIDAAVASGRVDRLSAEFYLNLLITLLILAMQLRLSDQSEARLSQRIASTESVITERLAAIERDRDTRPLVYARRSLELRSAPRSRASVFGVWDPNVPGRIVKTRRDWVEIEYFDRMEERHIAGWCRKKYVVRSSDK